MKWFRFYSDALDDPKVQRLPGDLFKAWVNILCLASRYSGTLPPMEDMKFALRLSEAKITTLLDELAAHGLIDDTGDGLQPHNWKKRQYKSDNVTARVQAHRDHCNVSVTPDETFLETPPKRFGNGATENRERTIKLPVTVQGASLVRTKTFGNPRRRNVIPSRSSGRRR